MELNKSQTYLLLHNIRKQKVIRQKYKFTTKFKSNCLNCMKPIYIRYDAYGRKNCFCAECYSKFQDKPTIAQYKYIQVQKEKQLQFIENNIEKTLKNK